ncbi:hypothetical protein [Xanthomonas citri]|uniref:hypothetical protein n=1 Tax=Xanthomonas citri TaxID=346 RepID=UPI001056C9BD|nr:hypothetical protein [Xanthomonas citri]QTF19422.1 hypothetical protein XcfCFBP6992P_23305 [Xanthomonas citri pv. phaseoli var. fuscans]QTF76495.1 hypothetical protein XcfCFBP6994P_22940 [Xanthomonas citri pv. phaseoli var. fuscans]QTF76711.1 hypothetical protein XcfCFBP6996P_22625 [Xanthomonas citri pv. phaseoli var. fuscans]
MFESLATKYLESVSAKVSFRYVLLFLLGFIFSFASDENGAGGLLRWIVDFKLSYFASWDYWKEHDPRLGNLLFSVCFVCAGVFIERLMATFIFLIMDRGLGYRPKVRKTFEIFKKINISAQDRQVEISIIEAALLPVSRKITFRASIAQFCGSCSFLLLFMPNSSTLDACVGLGMLVIIGLLIIRSIQIFIADYFPLATFRNILQRKSEPEIDDELKV